MIKYYDDGRPKGITYMKSKGKRPASISVIVGNVRTSLSVGEGMDFFKQWSKVVSIVIKELDIPDSSTDSEVLLDSHKAFLKHYGLTLQKVTIFVVKE